MWEEDLLSIMSQSVRSGETDQGKDQDQVPRVSPFSIEEEVPERDQIGVLFLLRTPPFPCTRTF